MGLDAKGVMRYTGYRHGPADWQGKCSGDPPVQNTRWNGHVGFQVVVVVVTPAVPAVTQQSLEGIQGSSTFRDKWEWRWQRRTIMLYGGHVQIRKACKGLLFLHNNNKASLFLLANRGHFVGRLFSLCSFVLRPVHLDWANRCASVAVKKNGCW